MRGRPWAAAPEVMVTGAGRAGPSEPQSPRASGTTHEACGLWPQGGQGTWSPGQWASSSADGNPPPPASLSPARGPAPRGGLPSASTAQGRGHRTPGAWASPACQALGPGFWPGRPQPPLPGPRFALLLVAEQASLQAALSIPPGRLPLPRAGHSLCAE